MRVGAGLFIGCVGLRLRRGRERDFDTCFNTYSVKKVLKSFTQQPTGREANFAPSTSTNRRRRVSANLNLRFMATSNTTTATRNNVVVNPQSATANTATADSKPKTQRVLETRDQWSAIFAHTVALLAAAVKGEALPDDPRKGYAFGKPQVEPHSRQYAQSLLAGFASKKAGKVFTQHEVLADQAKREEIAIAILLKTKLAKASSGAEDAKTAARRTLSKAEAKQGRSLAEALLAALGEAKQSEPKADATPKGVEAKPKKSAKKAKQAA